MSFVVYGGSERERATRTDGLGPGIPARSSGGRVRPGPCTCGPTHRTTVPTLLSNQDPLGPGIASRPPTRLASPVGTASTPSAGISSFFGGPRRLPADLHHCGWQPAHHPAEHNNPSPPGRIPGRALRHRQLAAPATRTRAAYGREARGITRQSPAGATVLIVPDAAATLTDLPALPRGAGRHPSGRARPWP